MSLNKLRIDQPWDLQARNILNKLIALVDTLSTSALSDGDKGDITVSGSGSVFTIDNGVVSSAKLGTSAYAAIMSRVSLRF